MRCAQSIMCFVQSIGVLYTQYVALRAKYWRASLAVLDYTEALSIFISLGYYVRLFSGDIVG